jgi:hypothetical protein
MFFWKSDKSRLIELEREVLRLKTRVGILEDRWYKSLEQAPHGVKLDGTPKKKPGRKAK